MRQFDEQPRCSHLLRGGTPREPLTAPARNDTPLFVVIRGTCDRGRRPKGGFQSCTTGLATSPVIDDHGRPEATWQKLGTGEIEIRRPLPRRLFNGDGRLELFCNLHHREWISRPGQQPLDMSSRFRADSATRHIGRRREEDSCARVEMGTHQMTLDQHWPERLSADQSGVSASTSTTSASGSQEARTSPPGHQPFEKARRRPYRAVQWKHAHTISPSLRRLQDDECANPHADRTAVA
jgi:hypothetical protein